jgi:hypothetical protein
MSAAAPLANPDVRNAADALLASYVKRNGPYRVRDLVEGALALGPNPDAALARLLQTARFAGDPAAFLSQIERENWLPANYREPLLRRQMQLAEDRFQASLGEEREFLQNSAGEARLRLVTLLISNNRPAEAKAILEPLQSRPGFSRRYDYSQAAIDLAARDGSLGASPARALEGLLAEPDFLRSRAESLRRANLAPAARALLRHLHQQELSQANPAPAWLGLAEIELEEGKLDPALAALDQAVMLASEPWSLHLEAARLLEKHNRPAQALKYATAVPWNPQAAILSAKIQKNGPALAAVAARTTIPYTLRTLAAAERDALNAPPAPRTVQNLRAELSRDPESVPDRRTLFSLLAQASRWREAVLAIGDRPWVLDDDPSRLQFAQALVETKEYARALDYLEPFEPSAQRDRLAAHAREAQRLEAANAQRRPVVKDTLEQPNLVRPQLLTQGGPR